LALILGHELAHFYRSHPWALEFGNAFAHRQRQSGDAEAAPASGPALNRDERRRLESEADYFGGFYSFLAGYHPLRVAAPVFDAVYREYQFNKSLPSYERLEDRKAAAQEAQGRLRQLEPLFEAGLFLSLLKDHLNAARVFDRIAADFPGPEIANNAGASLANESLRWFTETEQSFVYPLTFDPDTRLSDDGGRGGELGEEERLERRTALLEGAQARFERSVALLPGYLTGMVNLACVLDLLGRHEAAHQKALEALQVAGRAAEKREAYVIAGIAAARLGRMEEARKAFITARELGSQFAESNLTAMAGRQEGEAAADRTGQRPLLPQRIGGISIAEIRLADLLTDPDAKVLARWDAEEDLPELQIVKTMRGAAQALVILRGSAHKRSAAIVLSDSTMGGSKAVLSRGLPVAGVEAQFGSPSSVVLTSQGRYYVYQGRYHSSQLGLVIRLDADRLVRNWTSYRIDE
jgi:tetratricopeptide (TPR) repeat protein